MYDLIGIGELLMDMTPIKQGDRVCFMPNPGGAPCNFLAMAQKMGAKTAFIGKVGKDHFGQTLKETLEAVGVDTIGLVMDSDTPTTLAFVHLTEEGERSFSFYRKGCADVSLHKHEIDETLIEQTRAFYFGSLAFTDEPTRSTALAMIEKAKTLGKFICYDPNYRPLLWESEEKAIIGMSQGLKYADVLKVSDEEAKLLTGEPDLEKAAILLSQQGIALVCVTRGADGALACFKGECFSVPSYPVSVVDTTGAGDAFFGTLMQQILSREESLDQLTIPSVEGILRTANRAASLCVQAYGGIDSLPSRNMVLEAVT